MLNLTRIFRTELTEDKRVKVSMALPMNVNFTGLHEFFFNLTDDGVTGPPNMYHVTIVLGLYEADPIQIIPYVAPVVIEVDNTLDKENLVAPYPDIDWFTRRSYADRKAQLRVHPFSSDG